MEAYPLQWPLGYKRTKNRMRSQFKQSMEAAQRFLRDELSRMRATNLIVSTNLPVRKDGGIYADYLSRKIDDPGVAIYFRYNNKDIVMCCDQYTTVWENIYALGKGIEALRGMERWGVSDFLEKAFTGFAALPPAAVSKTWFQVLGFKMEPNTFDEAKAAYKQLAIKLHPDNGGTTTDFQNLAAAYDQAKNYFY